MEEVAARVLCEDMVEETAGTALAMAFLTKERQEASIMMVIFTAALRSK
jgi:hypothetical protein